MKIIDLKQKNDSVRSQAIEQLKVRLGGAPIVQPGIAQVALGTTAKSYLSNLTESSTITAVISSIGQIPQQVRDAQPANLPTFGIQPDVLSNFEVRDTHSTALQPVITDSPIQPIISLSELNVVNSAVTAPKVQLAAVETLTMRNLSNSVQTIAQQNPIVPIEHLAMIGTEASMSLRAADPVGIKPELSIFPSIVNSAPNLSGIGTLISLTPISTLSSPNPQPTTESNLASTFDGITVSGQADPVDVLVITVSALSPMFSRAHTGGVSNQSNTQNTEIGAYALEQHSILLISVQASSLSEAYSL